MPSSPAELKNSMPNIFSFIVVPVSRTLWHCNSALTLGFLSPPSRDPKYSLSIAFYKCFIVTSSASHWRWRSWNLMQLIAAKTCLEAFHWNRLSQIILIPIQKRLKLEQIRFVRKNPRRLSVLVFLFMIKVLKSRLLFFVSSIENKFL